MLVVGGGIIGLEMAAVYHELGAKITVVERKIPHGKGVFPWAASSRSLILGRSEGMTRLLFDEEHER